MCPGITPIVFQIGVTFVSTVMHLVNMIEMNLCYLPLLTSLTVLFPPAFTISPKSARELAQEIGKLGMEGMFSPSVRVEFS